MRPVTLMTLLLLPTLGGAARADLTLHVPADPKSDALVLGALLLTDNGAMRIVRRNNDWSPARSLAENVTRVMDPVKLTGLCLLGSQLASNREQQTRLKLAATAAVEAGAMTEILKQLTHRRRPDEALAQQTNPAAPSTYSSFPSGHAGGDFALFTVLAEKDRENRRLYRGLAVLVGLSRIYLDRHYPSDVFAGAVIGTLIGKHVAKRDRGLLSWRF